MSPEPWLRGYLKDENPMIAQVLYSFQHAKEDLEEFTRGLTIRKVVVIPKKLVNVVAN